MSAVTNNLQFRNISDTTGLNTFTTLHRHEAHLRRQVVHHQLDQAQDNICNVNICSVEQHIHPYVVATTPSLLKASPARLA